MPASAHPRHLPSLEAPSPRPGCPQGSRDTSGIKRPEWCRASRPAVYAPSGPLNHGGHGKPASGVQSPAQFFNHMRGQPFGIEAPSHNKLGRDIGHRLPGPNR